MPILDQQRLTEALVAEGMCTETEILNFAGKTRDGVALLDRLSRDHDGMLGVARRLGLPVPEPEPRRLPCSLVMRLALGGA